MAKKVPESDQKRVSFRVPEGAAHLIIEARTHLAENGRKVNDTRIFLAALKVLKLDDKFLDAYDGFTEMDGRTRALRKPR